MEFTDAEIALVNKYRAEQAAIATAQETLRRKQSILSTISDMVDQAKSYLSDAKQIAEDNGMDYEFRNLLDDIQNNIGGAWYASDTSHC